MFKAGIHCVPVFIETPKHLEKRQCIDFVIRCIEEVVLLFMLKNLLNSRVFWVLKGSLMVFERSFSVDIRKQRCRSITFASGPLLRPLMFACLCVSPSQAEQLCVDT